MEKSYWNKDMGRKLSICHVITRMIIGGAQENTLLTIIGHLEKGHKVTLITGPTEGPEGKLLEKSCPKDLTIIELPSLIRSINPLKDLQAYFQLKAIFKKNKFDVVHTHASKAGILGRIAARHAGVPVVVHTVHGQAFHPYQAWYKNKLYIFTEKLAARYCDRIYAVAQAMIDQCVAAGVAKPEKYKVVYSGMRLNDFINQKPEPELRQKLGIPTDCFVIGKIARLFELKGHDCLIESARIIVQKVPNVRFLLVGDGNLRTLLEEKIKNYKLEKYFVFAGLVAPSEVCRYTALMDVLAHLSLREGLPRTAVQALASSIPVVAYPLDGTPEVVFDHKTGLLCPPEDIAKIADALIYLLEHEEIRKEYGRAGQKLVRDLFDWHRMADILEQEYRKELEEKRKK
ncbi:MAG: glycosyltransferase family 4 protein [Lentisphaeria bacterium]